MKIEDALDKLLYWSLAGLALGAIPLLMFIVVALWMLIFGVNIFPQKQ